MTGFLESEPVEDVTDDDDEDKEEDVVLTMWSAVGPNFVFAAIYYFQNIAGQIHVNKSIEPFKADVALYLPALCCV